MSYKCHYYVTKCHFMFCCKSATAIAQDCMSFIFCHFFPMTVTRLGSLKVIGTDTYRSATYDHGPISYRFRDRRRFQSKIANFPTPVYFAPGWQRSPWNWVDKNLEWWGYRAEKEVWRYLQPSGYNTPTWRTNRRTPGDSKDRAYA